MTDGGSLPAPHSLYRLPCLCPRLRLLLHAALAPTPASPPAPAPAPARASAPALACRVCARAYVCSCTLCLRPRLRLRLRLRPRPCARLRPRSGLVWGRGREMSDGEAERRSVNFCRAPRPEAAQASFRASNHIACESEEKEHGWRNGGKRRAGSYARALHLEHSISTATILRSEPTLTLVWGTC